MCGDCMLGIGCGLVLSGMNNNFFKEGFADV